MPILSSYNVGPLRHKGALTDTNLTVLEERSQSLVPEKMLYEFEAYVTEPNVPLEQPIQYPPRN